jgi:mRNA interferase MazF
MFTPGDVILVNYPGAQGYKPRPGIVVSSADYHRVRPDVIVGVCPSNIAAARTPMDYVLKDWAAAGLRVLTAFRSYFETFQHAEIMRAIGHLSDHDWREVQARLRVALAVT